MGDFSKSDAILFYVLYIGAPLFALVAVCGCWMCVVNALTKNSSREEEPVAPFTLIPSPCSNRRYLSPSWCHALGPSLRCGSDGTTKPTDDVLQTATIVALYFSADWSASSRAFTPALSSIYSAMKQSHPSCEIVFVSSDKSATAFASHVAPTPFAALPFRERQRAAKLRAQFGILGVPQLVFLTGDGRILTQNGVKAVTDCHGDGELLWQSLMSMIGVSA